MDRADSPLQCGQGHVVGDGCCNFDEPAGVNVALITVAPLLDSAAVKPAPAFSDDAAASFGSFFLACFFCSSDTRILLLSLFEVTT